MENKEWTFMVKDYEDGTIITMDDLVALHKELIEKIEELQDKMHDLEQPRRY